MPSKSNQFEALRNILENSHLPQRLDTHPWTRSLIVRQCSAETPELLKRSSGQRLVISLATLFVQMMPATPPRRGKRMDTRWGEFGILAAQFFAPLIYGTPVPASLREAWGLIDQSILLFVYGKPAKALSETEIELYKLVGNEISIAPNSTLSDWHRNGLERLLELIVRRESYLSGTLAKPAVIFSGDQLASPTMRQSIPPFSGKVRIVFIILGILLLGSLLFGGIRGWEINKQVMRVRQDAEQMRDLVSTPGFKLDKVKAAGSALSTLRHDFLILKNKATPFLWMGPLLGWVPVYGGDLASAQSLMNIADSMLASADISYQVITPLLDESLTSGLGPTQLTESLVQAQPQLIEASRQLALAVTARSDLDADNLTPNIRNLIIKDIDPLITLMGEGLGMAEELPRLMGASDEGPKSYLVLAQNEDELRPTGGFITAVGTLLVDNGRISDLTFDNSTSLDNWSKPYPAAPWQLQQYMDTSVLVLRDSNWYTDYPTAALYAETLYTYAKAHAVDGVIAFDQQFLVETLGVVGPIKLEGVAEPIDSSNVIAFMRSAKTPSTTDLASQITSTKTIFLKKITDALVGKLFGGEILPEPLVNILLQALNERHLLLKMDSLTMTNLLARHRWDGAVHPQEGDFLMVVDTNVGFNKTNAVVQSSLTYDVDLTKPTSPIGSLTVVHKNSAAGIICKQSNKIRLSGEEFYPITDCYWNYLRVYKRDGTKLLDAVPQFVPANWMIVKQDVPARVDILDEGIKDVQAFGTLQVIPGGESLAASFRFALPGTVVRSGDDQSIYHLLVQKQPGTLSVPLTIRVHLPNNASVTTAPAEAVVQDQSILYQTDLRTDLVFEIVFYIP